ncbi:hypothetical protein V6U89_16725 [Micromonospora sp. CPCC 206171]|uniref:hypothetical protein n=1 Tax=Micromonospora sp. CPCC 206171 TaxID=3122405 RepID=UPI002FF3ED06
MNMRTKHRRRMVSVLLTAVTAVSMLGACTGGSPAAVVNPIGGVLGSLEATVNGIIDEAGRQGQILTVTAGGQVYLAINNAESAFATALNTGIDKVDDATRRTIEQLQAMVKQLQSGATELLNAATNDAQQLINSLPFTNKNPQVRAFSPRFVGGAKNEPVPVSVQGNFFWASEKKLDVTLQVGGVTYKAAENLTSDVQFLVPANVFPSSPDRAQQVSMELHAPYEKGVIFKSRPIGVFHLMVTVLPSAPTKRVTVTNDEPIQSTEYRTISAPAGGTGWDLRSWDGCRDKNDTHTISAADGWTIDVPSVAIQYGMQTPDALAANATLDSVSPTGFVVSGHTIAHCFLGISKGSGSLNYSVTYTESRPVHSTNTTVRTLDPFSWGSQQVIPVTRGKWRVHAELWNGSVVESAGTSRDNPYLTVDDQGDYVKISVISPDSIVGLTP